MPQEPRDVAQVLTRDHQEAEEIFSQPAATALRRTSATARSIAQHTPAALTRTRALLLDRQLATCTVDPPPGQLRQIVIAIRALAGPGWLTCHASDPVVSAFTALDTAADPPPLPLLDHILARCLQARFPPAVQPPHSPGPARQHR
jgi:hypothetical protein